MCRVLGKDSCFGQGRICFDDYNLLQQLPVFNIIPLARLVQSLSVIGALSNMYIYNVFDACTSIKIVILIDCCKSYLCSEMLDCIYGRAILVKKHKQARDHKTSPSLPGLIFGTLTMVSDCLASKKELNCS